LSLFADVIAAWSGPKTDRALELVADVARVHSRQLLGESVSVIGALGRTPSRPAVIDIRAGTIDLQAPAAEPGPDPDVDPGAVTAR
jgi:hypothetical protein